MGNLFKNGFSLIELILVIAILVILSSLAVGYFRNFAKNVELEEISKKIISDLRNSREKAMSGENNLKWGTHFINGASDYYEIFSTPTDYSGGTVSETSYLPSAIYFAEPGEGQNSDVIFSKITGTTTVKTITISSEGNQKTINVGSLGNVY